MASLVGNVFTRVFLTFTIVGNISMVGTTHEHGECEGFSKDNIGPMTELLASKHWPDVSHTLGYHIAARTAGVKNNRSQYVSRTHTLHCVAFFSTFYWNIKSSNITALYWKWIFKYEYLYFLIAWDQYTAKHSWTYFNSYLFELVY